MNDNNNFPPRDYDRLEPWFRVIRHANSIIAVGALQWVEIGVFIGDDGTPQLWEVKEPRRLSPKDYNKVDIRD